VEVKPSTQKLFATRPHLTGARPTRPGTKPNIPAASPNMPAASPNMPAASHTAEQQMVKCVAKRNAARVAKVTNVTRPDPDVMEESIFDDSDEDPNFVPSDSSSDSCDSGLDKISIMKTLQKMKPKTDLKKNVEERKCANSKHRKVEKKDESERVSPPKMIKIAEKTFRSKPLVTTQTVKERSEDNKDSNSEFQVLKCSICWTFQSILLARKAVSWKCMACLEQQSIKQVYFKGSMKACCKVAKNLSSPEKEKDIAQETVTPSSNPGLKCRKCRRDFKNLKSFIKHEKQCGLTVICCNKCQVKFKTIRYLKRHVRNMHKEPEYMCEHEGCGMRFLTKFKLKTHMKNHNARCNRCDKLFKNTNSLKTHKLKRHTNKTRDSKKAWICPVCQHKVNSARGLRYHKEIHKGIGKEADVIEVVKDTAEVLDVTEVVKEAAGVQDIIKKTREIAEVNYSEDIGMVDQMQGVINVPDQCDLAQGNSSIVFFDAAANVYIEVVEQPNVVEEHSAM